MSKLQKSLFILLILIIGGFGGIVANRFIFPYLSTTSFFSKYDFMKQANKDVTIINKTEQVYVKDDTTVDKLTSQVVSSVVSIVSYGTSEKPISRVGQKNIPEQAQTVIKSGAGMIVTSDGIIMTYKDAILPENAKYKVVTSDSNIYDADLAGADSYSNLVFLKINASNLSAVSFVNPDELKSGEKMIAIGNNSDTYDPMFAVGLLSKFDGNYNLADKNVSSSEKLSGVFDVNLVPNRAYVGGPAIDYAGQVIGITGVVNKGSGDEYFVIPSDKIKLAIDKAVKKSFVNNASLGVYYVPISKLYANINNLPTEQGAQIAAPAAAIGQPSLAVLANSPAASGGLKAGDIITAVSGDKIDPTRTLSDLLYKHQKGEEVSLTVLRNSEEITLKIQL